MRYLVLLLLLTAAATAGEIYYGHATKSGEVGMVRIAPSGGGEPGDVVVVGDSRLLPPGGTLSIKGRVTLPAGQLSTTVVLATPQLTLDYEAVAAPVDSFLGVRMGTKTLTGFEINVEANPAGVTVAWVLVP